MNRKLLIRLVAFVVAFLFFPIQFVVVRAERYEVKPSFLGDLYSDEISSYIASGKLKVEATTIAVKISELDGVLVEQLNVEYLFARSATSLEISACVVGENVKLFENDKEWRMFISIATDIVFCVGENFVWGFVAVSLARSFV